MNESLQRTLLVHIERDTLRCHVLSVERSTDPNAWVVIVDSVDWLDGDRYADCTLRDGEVHTRGSYTILEHIVALEQGFFYTKGLFQPDAGDASPKI